MLRICAQLCEDATYEHSNVFKDNDRLGVSVSFRLPTALTNTACLLKCY